MHKIEIDRSKRLRDEPHSGHNRYHPDIEPIIEVAAGEDVVIETRDAADGQLRPGTDAADIPHLDNGAIHPLTGPVFVKGAKPGDALEVEFVEIAPQPDAWSGIFPGLGLLRDIITEPYLVHWRVDGGWATSDDIPGVRIPGAPFMGISATAPSHEMLTRWREREARLIERGGFALPPDAEGAVPQGACGLAGLRTMPPRENGGNFDVKQLTAGARLFLPVFEEGALFSTGDGHFAQGDGEVCVTAVEMGATVAVRFTVHEGLAARRPFTAPVFSRESFHADPKYAVPERFLGVMGYPLDDAGENEAENLTLAARNAVLNMMALIEERGFTREQAYVICSVAADLHVSNVVDLPNVTVSAILPEAIFGGD